VALQLLHSIRDLLNFRRFTFCFSCSSIVYSYVCDIEMPRYLLSEKVLGGHINLW